MPPIDFFIFLCSLQDEKEVNKIFWLLSETTFAGNTRSTATQQHAEINHFRIMKMNYGGDLNNKYELFAWQLPFCVVKFINLKLFCLPSSPSPTG